MKNYRIYLMTGFIMLITANCAYGMYGSIQRQATLRAQQRLGQRYFGFGRTTAKNEQALKMAKANAVIDKEKEDLKDVLKADSVKEVFTLNQYKKPIVHSRPYFPPRPPLDTKSLFERIKENYNYYFSSAEKRRLEWQEHDRKEEAFKDWWEKQ